MTQFLTTPVGEALIKVLKEHLESDREAIIDIAVENSPADLEKNVPFILQLKAQINTLEAILDLKEFLSTELEETNQDEVQGTGTKNSSKGEEV